MPGEEIDARIIAGPDELAFVVIAGGELHGLGDFVGSCRQVENPNVLVALGIEIALVIVAIDGAADDVDVGLVLAGLRGIVALGGIFFVLGLVDVFRSGGAYECDALSVRGPQGT